MDLDTDPSDILLQFSALKSKQARCIVLQGILDQLHSDECRQLKDCLAARSFQCDIFGSLPVEVVAQISNYLGLSDIILFQRVCKRWHFLLSSPLVQSTVLHEHCGWVLPTASSAHNFAHYARRRLMLERGQPFSVVQYPLPRKDYGHPQPLMDYSKGKCAWVDLGDDGRCRGIALRDLRSGELQCFHTENRVPFCQVRISDSLVAAVSVRGYCHVWNHHTHETDSFRLPSMRFEFFMVSKLTVALNFGDCVMKWDFASRSAHVIDVELGTAYMTLDSSGDSLIAVYLFGRDGKDSTHVHVREAQLRIARYPLNVSNRHPSPVSLTNVKLPKLGPDLVFEKSWGVSSVFHNRIGALGIRPVLRNLKYYLLINHDPLNDRISLHLLPTEYARTYPVVSIGYNLLYSVVRNSAKPGIEISSPDAFSQYRCSNFMRVDHESRDDDPPACALYGDREFVLLVDKNGLTAWCFDETAQPPGSCPVPASLATE